MKSAIKFFFLAIALLFLTGTGECFAKRMSDARINAELMKLMEANKVPGMTMVWMKGDKPIFQTALGVRDLQTGEPIELDDYFRIASISKTFVGAAVQQLVDEGKISLDTPAEDILGYTFRNPRYPEIPITIRQLLSHTSSMRDFGLGPWYKDDRYVNPNKTTKDTIKMMFFDYAPGQGFKYCNRALNMMGVIIEKVSGERFDEYIRKHILEPAGITNAGFNNDMLDQSKKVSLYNYNKKSGGMEWNDGYKRTNEKRVAAGKYRMGRDAFYWSPTGGMKISSPELAKWMKTLQNGGVAPNGNRILSAEAVRRMTTPLTPCTGRKDWAFYGMTCFTGYNIIKGVTLKGHGGSARGLKSIMVFNPESDWGFVCICSGHNGAHTEDDVPNCYYDLVNFVYSQLKAEL